MEFIYRLFAFAVVVAILMTFLLWIINKGSKDFYKPTIKRIEKIKKVNNWKN